MTLLILLAAILFVFSLHYQMYDWASDKAIMTRELKTIDQIYSSIIRSRILTVGSLYTGDGKSLKRDFPGP